MQQEIVLQQVINLRTEQPRMGGRKLYFMLKDFLITHNIKMGRDQLFNLLYEHNLLVKRKRRRISTTNSRHRFRKYSNLIKELEVNRAEHVWVSDITYINTQEGFCYLSLITDAYSHKIVGYYLSHSLATDGCLKALEMALNNRLFGLNSTLIHHSDRGIQYCSSEYVNALKRNHIQISMTEKSDPFENAIAERVNGILKDEFNLAQTFNGHNQAKKKVDDSIFIYNNKRPHLSCDYLTPNAAHEIGSGQLNKRWKTYYKKENKIFEYE